jgi:hypothetical protein
LVDPFLQLHFKNHLELVKYLARQGTSLKCIALHRFDGASLKRDYQTNRYNCFELILERGQQDFLLPEKSLPSDFAGLLWREGKHEVLNWIDCFVRGILELQ